MVVAHSPWDGGRSADLFDRDPATLARTENANPAVLEFRFPVPRPLKGLSITMGGRDFTVTATLQPEGGGPPKAYRREFRGMPADPTLDLDFDTGETKIESVRVEILDVTAGTATSTSGPSGCCSGRPPSMDHGRAKPAAGEARDGPTPRQNLIFFGLTLAVFLATRLWGLERFPIFFFCDEAVQTVQAARLAANGMRDERGALLPTYLRNTEFYNLSVGVYLQVLPERLLPRSVFVARAVPIVVLFSAMAAVGLMLRDFLRLRFWWVGVLALSGFPGWFLHTRIAFELMLATAFYVWFLYFYLRYRSGRPRAAYAAAVFGALTFYGYNTFQPVIAVTALALLVVDASWHWQQSPDGRARRPPAGAARPAVRAVRARHTRAR